MVPRAIAAAQTRPVRGNVGANLEEHVRLVRVAAEEGALVLVFPELSLIGYELELASDLAFSGNDPVRIESQLHIGAFIIAPDRTIEVYTKHHLGAFSSSDGPEGSVPPAEETIFRPGRRNPLIRFGDNTAAVAVCADCSRPEDGAQSGPIAANCWRSSIRSAAA